MIPRKRELLIVEDNELNREILVAMLEDKYQLIEASNGQEGLELLRENAEQISIVLLDIQMPVMNGYEVLEAVAKEPKLKSIPIIVTTGNDRMDEEERCLQLGATDFIQKPYNPNIVLRRVENIIHLQEKTAALTEVEIDPVTGVYTRSAFNLYASRVLKENPDVDFSIIMTDIIGFQRYVELFGEVAYKLLRKEAEALDSFIDDLSVCGRYSFDQFVLLIPTPDSKRSDREKIESYERVCKRLSNTVGATVKLGVCEHVDHTMTLEAAVNRAKKAMRSVKHQYGQTVGFVNKELMARMRRNEAIEDAMEMAIEKNEMQVYFQPKHHAISKKLLGAEVLLRWNHPKLGPVASGEFVPIFEQTGFIVEADAFAWREACRYLNKWKKMGLPNVPLSVNTTRLDYESRSFDSRLFKAVEEMDVEPELLHVEVTEQMFTDLSEEGMNMLKRCRQLGMLVELDDFGTGYSTLNSIAELPIDIVKFDQVFVRNLDNPRQRDVLSGCVDLVKRLKLKSVAEGVETETDLQQVINLGIDMVQGYYFAKPMPADEFEKYISKNESMTREEYMNMGHDPRQAEIERLRRLAEEDPLTGLSNRYRLYNNMNMRITQLQPFTMVLFDIDKFKVINDTYGHQIGDKVLVSVANLMRKDFEKCDLIRLGGDEFVIIFDGVIGYSQMMSEMQTFFYHIQNLKIEGMETYRSFSISAGCACYQGETGTTFENLYTKADKSLYVSKRTNGCCLNY